MQLSWNYYNLEYQFLLQIACQKGDLETIKLILNIPGVDVNIYDGSPLCCAIRDKRVDIVKEFIKMPDIKINIRHGFPLRHACITGNLEMVRTILSVPDVDANPQKGYTLYHSLDTEYSTNLDTLVGKHWRNLAEMHFRSHRIQPGLRVNISSRDTLFVLSPFMIACSLGHAEIARLILDTTNNDATMYTVRT